MNSKMSAGAFVQRAALANVIRQMSSLEVCLPQDISPLEYYSPLKNELRKIYMKFK